jgi:hypothetical protein
MIIPILGSIITLLLGFVGTFICRLVLAKHSLIRTIRPTLVHLFIYILLIVPIFGYIVYILGTIYYVYKNFIILNESKKTLIN